MKRFAADLHIHTALSPCASKEMTPPQIVREAVRWGLAIIAVCDHNASGNSGAVQEAAGEDLTVIAGIEITTAEEAHVLGLFPHLAAAEAVSEEVGGTLRTCPPGRESGGAPSRFGEQLRMTAEGVVCGKETRMLATASGFSLSATVDLIKRNGGLAIAAHADRPSFSVMSQLGMFPTDAPFDAIEISAAGVAAKRDAEFAHLTLPLVASSDAHSLSEIGSAGTVFEVLEPSFSEISSALRGDGGRRHWHA